MKTYLRLIAIVGCLFMVIRIGVVADDDARKPAKPKTIVINRSTTKEEKKLYKLIPLASMNYQTVDRMCRPWLSKDGVLVHEKKRNSVLVFDTQTIVDKIGKFIRDADREAVNIRIEVSFMNTGGYHDKRLRVDVDSGRSSHQKLVWRNGKFVKPKNIEINPRITKGRTHSNTSQIIMTQSGVPAALFSGTRQVDPGWLSANRAFYRPTTYIVGPGGGVVVIEGTDLDLENHIVDIGAKLQVNPVYNDNGTITLEFYPEVSWIVGEGNQRYVRKDTVTTKITVQDGKRVYIGGVISKRGNQMKSLFGPELYSSEGISNILDMYVTATAVKPNGRRLNPRKRIPGREDPWGMFDR